MLLIRSRKFNGTALLGATVNITDDLDGGVFAVGSTNTPAIAATRTVADTKMAEIQKDLGNVAAGMAGLKGIQAALYSLSANSEAAASRLMDTDFAYSSAQLAKFTVLNQSAMAMVAQANQANSALLAVLQ